eukprot:g277.t1
MHSRAPTTPPSLDAATLKGLIRNAAALLAHEENDNRLDANQHQFHLSELLNYIAALEDKMERHEGDFPAALMPMRIMKQRSERRRARFWACGLELFNEAGDILLLPKMLVLAPDLFVASLTCLIGSVLMRLFNALRLWGRVKTGKVCRFALGVLVNLVEPNSGMELIKATLNDSEKGSRTWDHNRQEEITLAKDPVAVMSYLDWAAGRAEASNILVMVFGEDVPESLISVIYAIKLRSQLDGVFALSALGTLLHLLFQLSTYWMLRQRLPALKNIAEGRDKTFDKDATDER